MKLQIELTDEEVRIMHHDLLDVKEWITGAIVGKINNCKKRAAIQYRELIKKEGALMVPANDDDAVRALFARQDYKNRTQREIERGN